MRRNIAKGTPRRALVGAAGIVLLLIAGVAIGGQKAAGKGGDKGKSDVSKAVQAAPNVIVVNAPPAAGSAAPAPATQGGWRAAIDPATGQLRDLEPAEVRALAEEREITAFGVNRTAEPQQIEGPGGGEVAMLDESHMSYSVAHKHADGSVSTQCNQNHAAGKKALAQKPKKEVRNDR